MKAILCNSKKSTNPSWKILVFNSTTQVQRWNKHN
jgi:hypothetical protein